MSKKYFHNDSSSQLSFTVEPVNCFSWNIIKYKFSLPIIDHLNGSLDRGWVIKEG